MAENGSELRRIGWAQAFPFVRLFDTLRLSLSFWRLALALAAVICLYLGGRVFDLLWSRHAVVVGAEMFGHVRTEIEAYAALPHAQFAEWLEGAKENRREAGERLPKEETRPTADKLAQLRADVRTRLEAALEALEADQALSSERKEERGGQLREAADRLQLALARRPARIVVHDAGAAVDVLLAAPPALEAAERTRLQSELTTAAATQTQVREYERLKPRGIFASLVNFESRCCAAAVQGVCNGYWGFDGGALDSQPALGGSLVSALHGMAWLFNQRPLYAILFSLFSLVVLAYFGGGICRSAALQAARDESVSAGQALRFVRERYSGFLLAPLLPIGVILVIWLFMFVGGLLGGLIPYLGEVLTGILYFLGLLGGFVAAVVGLALVLGFHLMWPAIAVEGSDGFDALSRAASYVGSRIFHLAYYVLVLLVYGAFSFVLVRWVVLLTLKCAHKFTGSGMNLFDSSEAVTPGKLDALWTMPAWSDLPVLPARDVPTVGWFHNAPLDGAETFAAWLLALWAYLLLGLLAAFVLSYFFCGSTQIYFLLRRSVDATDYDEVYYEEPEEEAPPAVPAGTAPAESTESAPSPPPAPPPPPAPGEAPPPEP
ncbi:MAG: hypothetical protein AB1716_20310 [Planctomycetota bacterium]